MNFNYTDRKYPEKSWSISRMKILNSCEREYYYTYYGSHNGWKFNSNDEQKLAWRLKKLTNLWMSFGEVVHGQIRGILHYYKQSKESSINPSNFNDIALKKLRDIVRESMEKYKNNEWNEYPKGTMLEEYYYGGEISKETGNELKERLLECVNNFYVSKTFEEILHPKAIIIENDEDTFNSFEYNGLKIYSKPDLLYIDTEGNYIIVDWKTGKESANDKEQLLAYAWYVRNKYGISFSNIKGRIEYLLLGKKEEVSFNDEDLDTIKEKVETDLKIINYYLDDIELNKPKEKEEFLKNCSKKKCSLCKFRLLCND